MTDPKPTDAPRAADTPGDWKRWRERDFTLVVPPKVHAPSPFSAVLASSLPDLTGKVVIDAGSGAGLISTAALEKGASHVIACDFDPVALGATLANVERHLGAAAAERLSLLQCDFRHLGFVRADVVLVNPPQRPAAILDRGEPAHRHLHEGGGTDGLATLRLLLHAVDSAELWTTAAAILPIRHITAPRWNTPNLVHTSTVPMHPAWIAAGSSVTDNVGVWVFTRNPPAGPMGRAGNSCDERLVT